MKSAGRRLIIDGITTNESNEIISSVQQMSVYLERVTEITGMTLVIPPIAMKFPFAGETQRLIKQLEQEGTKSLLIDEFKKHINERDTKQGGVSAITVWLESHASLHSWPKDNYISIDLYSCKQFTVEPILQFTQEFMKLKRLNCLIVDRKMDDSAEVTRIIY